MGIKDLMKLINEETPEAVKEKTLENYMGRMLAIDASMSLYQFMIAVRTAGSNPNMAQSSLTNADGEVTSHIQGMWNRTIKLLSTGIKPVFVFDGKPPAVARV